MGSDQLFGGSGNDQLLGGEGNDLLKGDAGLDKLWGDAGDDGLWGGSGADELRGGTGTDVLHRDRYDTVVEEEPPAPSSAAWFVAPEGEEFGSCERAIAGPAVTNRPNARRLVSASPVSAELPVRARANAKASADFRPAADELFGDFDGWDAEQLDDLLPV